VLKSPLNLEMQGEPNGRWPPCSSASSGGSTDGGGATEGDADSMGGGRATFGQKSQARHLQRPQCAAANLALHIGWQPAVAVSPTKDEVHAEPLG